MQLAEAIRESMSVVMDGEGNDVDIARVLKAIETDPAARAHWQRLQSTQHLVRTGHAAPNIDVSAAVAEALNGDAPQSRRTAGPLTSLAVAASVTLAVVFGGQQILESNPQQDNSVRQVPNAIMTVAGGAPVQARFGGTAAPAASPAAQEQAPAQRAVHPRVVKVYEQLALERLKRFGTDHASAAAGVLPHALVPFARLPLTTQ